MSFVTSRRSGEPARVTRVVENDGVGTDPARLGALEAGSIIRRRR